MVSAFPTSVLDMIKAKQVERRVATAEIHRPTRVPTPTGGMTTVWAPVATGVKIGIAEGPQGQTQYERLIQERFGNAVGFWLVFSAGFDVRPEDRVYQTAPLTRTFEVLAISNKDVSFETARRVLGVVLG
jgi:hypothetical protein